MSVPSYCACWATSAGGTRDHVAERNPRVAPPASPGLRRGAAFSVLWLFSWDSDSTEKSWGRAGLRIAGPMGVTVGPGPSGREYREPMTPTGEDADLETLLDLTTPWCLLVVATLRIADHLPLIEVGAVLELLATDEAVLGDLPAWCRATGQEFLGFEIDLPVYRGYARRTH